ncbi:MAG TPA: alpha/beta fold hydrolase [Rhizomicrobium sp.]|nr:alpha/beta fold hydrolase [Rhizomicrobium sp.]
MSIRSAAQVAALLCTLVFTQAAVAQTDALPPPVEGDYIAHDFTFRSGETLKDLRLHYTTFGKPHRDSRGHVDNAVLIMHGTGGDGHQFIRPQFSGVLFVPGGLLDVSKYYVILPDGIGHGKSSKPSDGLHAKFPHYDYDDMVAADYLLLTKGLKVDHLRLAMGTSMGCMHSFVLGETYPAFADALMPLACLPTQIAGRNRLWRKLVIDAIQSDPAWMGGEYKEQPKAALRTAESLLLIAGGAPIVMQKTYPTREAADAYAEKYIAERSADVDANDLMYQVAASRTYDPSIGLDKITAPVMWVNSGDDFINPPELGLAEGYAAKLKRGRYVLIPASDQTHGHGTHTWAAIWQSYLAEVLKESAAK